MLIVVSFLVTFHIANKMTVSNSKHITEVAYTDWQPVQMYEPKIQVTPIIPLVKFLRSKVKDQAIPNISSRNFKTVSYRHVRGIRLTIDIKNLFGDGMSRLPIVNGVDRDIELDGMISDMKYAKLFTKPSETFVHLYDNFIIIEYCDDDEKLNNQVEWIITQLSLRFKINLVESNKL